MAIVLLILEFMAGLILLFALGYLVGHLLKTGKHIK